MTHSAPHMPSPSSSWLRIGFAVQPGRRQLRHRFAPLMTVVFSVATCIMLQHVAMPPRLPCSWLTAPSDVQCELI